MSLIFRNLYFKYNQQIKTKKTEWLGIIRSYGQLSEKLNFGDYIIEPYDNNRDVMKGTESYQLLKITINHVEPEDAKGRNPNSISNEICSLLCLPTGRKMVHKNEFLLKLEDRYNIKYIANKICSLFCLATGRKMVDIGRKIIDKNNNLFKGQDGHKLVKKKCQVINNHNNLLASIEIEETQQILNKIWLSLQEIRNEDSYKKLCTLIQAIHLYQGSLEIIEDNYEAAYILLISSAETIAEKFSCITPTLKDLPQREKIGDFFNKHKLESNLEQELLNILFRPNHIKLRAKLVDVILNNLDSDFFDKPPTQYIMQGKDFKDDGSFTFTGWRKQTLNGWDFKEDEPEKLLKNIYDCRSQFVHSGVQFPHWSKLPISGSGIAPIKTDKNGTPQKDKQGNYKTEKKVISYFVFERIMNNVLINLFDKL